jgi:HEAT repeat protein
VLWVLAPGAAWAQDDAVRANIERLRSSTPSERAAAAEALGRSGHEARDEITPILRQLLRDDSEWEVRASAGRALGRLGTRDAVPDLVRALRDPVVDVRVVAAAALWRLPDPAAVPPLLDLLSDPDANARQWATLALGVIRDTRAVAPLVALLDDPEGAVRLDVIRSLGRIRAAAALAPLEERAGEASAPADERVEAVNAIAALEAPQRIDALVRLIDSRERRVREAAVVALGQVGDALALPALRRRRGEERVPALRTAIDTAIAAIEARGAAH